MLLGLCSPHDPFYQWVIADKYPYVAPEDQTLLRALATMPSLLSMIVLELEAGPPSAPLRENASLLLDACRQHGAATVFHHNKLVVPFLQEPAADAPEEHHSDMTASGPPLAAVISTLAQLRDLRAARQRPDLETARAALDRVQELLDDADNPGESWDGAHAHRSALLQLGE